MTNSTKFKSKESGNPATKFKPGNPHRWQQGQSGNPDGISRSRLKFEETFYAALIEQGAPQEAASLLWQCARAQEPRAVQALLQRLAPQTEQIKCFFISPGGDHGSNKHLMAKRPQRQPAWAPADGR